MKFLPWYECHTTQNVMHMTEHPTKVEPIVMFYIVHAANLATLNSE